MNVFGVIRVTQAFLPLLLAAAPGARIVMVSSSRGSFGRALDLAPRGILVNAAAPGYMATDLNGHRGHRTVQQASDIIVRLATFAADGPTGGFFDEEGRVPW